MSHVCLCACAVGWVEVGLIVLILSLLLFLYLLRFWDEYTDKQTTDTEQVTDLLTNASASPSPYIDGHKKLFQKSTFVRCIKTTDLQGREQESRSHYSNKQPKCRD